MISTARAMKWTEIVFFLILFCMLAHQNNLSYSDNKLKFLTANLWVGIQTTMLKIKTGSVAGDDNSWWYTIT